MRYNQILYILLAFLFYTIDIFYLVVVFIIIM